MVGRLAYQQYARQENINRFAKLFIDRNARSINDTVPSLEGKRLE